MWNKLFTATRHPLFIGVVCITLALSGAYGIVTVLKNARQNQIEQVEQVENPYRAYVNDARIDNRYEPTWDADPLLYNITDGESLDRTPQMIVREWTPWGNKDIRCVATGKNGGVTCFPKGQMP